jgi:hypothetical protein
LEQRVHVLLCGKMNTTELRFHNDQGNKTTPSFVAFTDHQRLIGEAAKNQTASNPQNTVFGKFLISIFSMYLMLL